MTLSARALPLVVALALGSSFFWNEVPDAAREARGAGKLSRALDLEEQGTARLAQSDFAGAEAALRESLRLRREAAPGSLAEASSWHALGKLERQRGALDKSEQAFRTALDLRARLAPRSLERAYTLNNLGINAWYRGDLEGAGRFYAQAHEITRSLAPGSTDEAQVLNNLGLLARARGDFQAAERYLTQAGRIWQRLEPEGLDLARNFSNLGTLAQDRGDLAMADQRLRAALARFEELAPESAETATILKNLGVIARDRFDVSGADILFRRALTIHRRLVPGSLEEAASLSNVAFIAVERGRLDEAERLARQALAIRNRISKESTEFATSLSMLGTIAFRRGDAAAGIALCEQALAIQRKTAPGTLFEAAILQGLGIISHSQERYGDAEGYMRQALAIRQRLAPASRATAESLDYLGLTLWRAGRAAEAEPLFTEAIAALEAQSGRLGGSDEARSALHARFAEIYWDLIQWQVEHGRPAEALHTLERSRARSLLSLLAERDLAFRNDVPAPLLAWQRRLDREYEEGQEALADSENPEETELLLARLARLRGERAALVARITQASPSYASLRYPQPLDVAGIQRALDPGTVWLSYLATDSETLLFVVSPTDVQVLELPATAKDLEREVAVFRSLILRGRDGRDRGTAIEPALLAQGRRLYEILIAPAAPWIAPAARVLISPDGPLHTLPFGALVRPGEPAAFLVEWKPVHTVLSATLYAELKRGRREGQGGTLVAFADPRYPKSRSGGRDSGTNLLARYRRGLPPLPAARREVEALAGLYGREAEIYLGAEATEGRVKSLGGAPRYLHFASHALLDRRFPLDSALALSAPTGRNEADNGLLQAWEIFERVRIDADLVTLSACETGLGSDAAGEGLIGLTRAFQYAGARSILASLWSVSDLSTAELMERFYGLLREGRPKDLALREAQRALLRGRGGRFAHPYHWAAFELIGDWR
jgi:CHAT domain-containing protein/Tfp pilus assembly protein PilF